jgi:hypothetical protein
VGNSNKDVTPLYIFELALEVVTATIVVTRATLERRGNLMMLLLLSREMALLFLDTKVVNPNVKFVANDLVLIVETTKHDIQAKKLIDGIEQTAHTRHQTANY